MSRRIVANRELCVGSATCLGMFPEAFDLDDDNTVVVMDGERSLSEQDREEMVSSCPGGVFDIVEG
jgi:ferredoxin